MELKRNPMEPIQIEVLLEKMRKKGSYSEDVMELVREDLEQGISKEEVDEYLKLKGSFRKKKIYSDCLRRGWSREMIDAVCGENMDEFQMTALFEMVKDQIPLDVIKEIAQEADYVPARMEKGGKKFLKAVEMEQKIREGEQEKQKLCDELDVNEKQLQEQQDRLNQAERMNARLKREKEELKEVHSKEIETLKEAHLKALEELKEAHGKAKDVLEQVHVREKEELLRTHEKEKEEWKMEMEGLKHQLEEKIPIKEESKNGTVAAAGGSGSKTVQDEPKQGAGTDNIAPAQTVQGSQPVHYQVPVVDAQGRVVRYVPLEQMQGRKDYKAIMKIFARLGLKKKSRQDLVELLIGSELVPDQMVQIKEAMARGLADEQLAALIRHNVSADRMKEIIEIAVMEKSLA